MDGRKLLVLLFIIGYIISPDLLPGPIDDIIVAMCALVASRGNHIMIP